MMFTLTKLFMFFPILIPLIIMNLNLMISKKKKLSYEKASPFECGFDPICFMRLPFSIQFFLISMIFLIFDTEITLLIPIIFIIKKPHMNVIFITLFIIMVLIWGLYLEFLETAIEWKS